MKVSTVLTIYGAIIMSARGVFTHSSSNTDTTECKIGDLSQHGPFREPRPYVLSLSVSNSSFPEHLIKLYNRTRRLPYMDYLLYIKGESEVPLKNLKKPYKRDSRLSVTFVKYVQMFHVPGQTICLVAYSDCYKKPEDIDTADFINLTLCTTHFERYVHALPRKLPDVLSFYNGTALSFINENCSDDDKLFPTLPLGTTIVNVINTNCTIDLLGKGYWKTKRDYSDLTLSNISAMNLTGSGKAMSMLLGRLITGKFCLQTTQTCQMSNLVSLDISQSSLDSLSCNEVGRQMHTTIPVINKFYARKIVHEPCMFYVKNLEYMSCILVMFTRCCRQNAIICIKPETLEFLDIAENSIEYIGTSMTAALTNLRVLDVSGNLLHIRNGGADINMGEMTSLTEFYCANRTA